MSSFAIWRNRKSKQNHGTVVFLILCGKPIYQCPMHRNDPENHNFHDIQIVSFQLQATCTLPQVSLTANQFILTNRTRIDYGYMYINIDIISIRSDRANLHLLSSSRSSISFCGHFGYIHSNTEYQRRRRWKKPELLK